MRNFVLIILCVVASKDVVAEDDNYVKQGTFPYMAFLYYSDESIIDTTDERFFRSAVFITNNWLISSSDASMAFPNKTLLARVGAVNIDDKFSLNEDQGEQEREIILIIRPYNYSETQWWSADISLLKTLLPFNVTVTMESTALDSNSGQTCFILVYAKRNDNATERTLTQMFVEILPSTHDNCGNDFRKESMLCAKDSDDKFKTADPSFCQGNSGGPLICDNALTGIQTYINDCKQPHLYQIFGKWKNLITCAIQGKCNDPTGPCAGVCVTLSKDPPISTNPYTFVTETPRLLENKSNESDKKFKQSITPTKSTTSAATEESVLTIKTSATMMNEMSEEQEVNDTSILTTFPDNIISNSSSELLTTMYKEEEAVNSTEKLERRNHIEAQHQLVRGEASTNSFMFQYLLTTLSVLAYLT